MKRNTNIIAHNLPRNYWATGDNSWNRKGKRDKHITFIKLLKTNSEREPNTDIYKKCNEEPDFSDITNKRGIGDTDVKYKDKGLW